MVRLPRMLRARTRALERARAFDLRARALAGESPVVQLCGVDPLGPQALQQHPGGAARQSRGRPGGEDEPDRPVDGEADVAVRPIGRILHEPLHICQGQVVDVERSP